MRVVVPYVDLEPAVALALEQQGIPAQFQDTSDDGAYWQLLHDLWAAGETVIVLEQDKVPAPGLLAELWGCPDLWCTTPVPVRNTTSCADYPTLSCVKFDAMLMAAVPLLIDDVGTIDYGFGVREWSRLDLGVAALLQTRFVPHWHEGGRIQHLHREAVAV